MHVVGDGDLLDHQDQELIEINVTVAVVIDLFDHYINVFRSWILAKGSHHLGYLVARDGAATVGVENIKDFPVVGFGLISHVLEYLKLFRREETGQVVPRI